jgi:prolyl oligopeptidase
MSIGLLVSACANRAPEGLLGAAVAEVGVHDLLKVHNPASRLYTALIMFFPSFLQFADFTIGHAWISDYGNPHDPHDFDFIYPISPVHNVPANKTLPPTLLLTADRT